MKYAGHQNRGMEANGPIVPAGGGYRENDATRSSLGEVVAREHVRLARARSHKLMLMREIDIDNGMVHLTPAANGTPYED